MTGWIGFDVPADDAARDGFDQGAADKSELLYQVLLNIDIDGVPAVDQLGSRAIGDSDNDGTLEILDAFGEPIYLQWQQENLRIDDVAANVWDAAPLPVPDGTGTFIGLSKEHQDETVGFGGPTNFWMYSKPVLPTQIRPFLISERLLRIDGVPSDYAPAHLF